MTFHTLRKYDHLLGWLLLTVSVLYICTVLFLNKSAVFKQYDPAVSQKKFEQSQWRVPNSKTPISDEDLYAYSGYKYINGENPILVNPEVPPFGKYMIGTFIQLFHNQFLLSIVVGFISLILIFIITLKVTQSFLASAVAVLLTSTHTLFIDQLLHAPQLDIVQLFFVLLVILFLRIHQETDKKLFLIIASVMIGLFLSIKVFLISLVLINAWLLLYYFVKKTSFKTIFIDFILINVTALITFCITYFKYFQYGHSLRELLGVQKFILAFYSNSHIDMSKLVGNYLFLLLFNRWRFWSSGYPVVHYDSWSIAWPILFVAGIISIFMLFKSNMKNINLLLMLTSFFVVYNLFLLMVPVFPRYLLLLFVPLHILIAMNFAKIVQYGKNQKAA